MVILITNDGKNKYQSYTAEVNISIINGMNNCSAEFRGYGATEQEAKAELMKAMKEMIANLLT